MIQKIPGLQILNFRSDIRPNYWFYSLLCDKNYPLDRDGIIQHLASKGVQSRAHYGGLISDQKPYLNCQTYRIEKARYYWEHVVNLPCSTNLTEEEVLYVVECLRKAG
ncbi:MAG: DegT/DnrJ/EryC1/StrS family aminotransferase [Bacillota bacterium]